MDLRFVSEGWLSRDRDKFGSTEADFPLHMLVPSCPLGLVPDGVVEDRFRLFIICLIDFFPAAS
jgi:hypothetical protein